MRILTLFYDDGDNVTGVLLTHVVPLGTSLHICEKCVAIGVVVVFACCLIVCSRSVCDVTVQIGGHDATEQASGLPGALLTDV